MGIYRQLSFSDKCNSTVFIALPRFAYVRFATHKWTKSLATESKRAFGKLPRATRPRLWCIAPRRVCKL